MAKTRIEWCRNPDGSAGLTINPVKGLCPIDCKDNEGKSYCYARRMYQRFKWNPEIRYTGGWWVEAARLNKPSRIFVGSTFELFHPSVTLYTDRIIERIRSTNLLDRHTFIFLTKKPWELKKYNPWPDNCWVGMSATNMSQIGDIPLMADVQAKVRFVSFEPLLDYSAPDLRYIDWVIIGQRTPVRLNIPESWIRGIENEADKQRIPVFHKNNLQIDRHIRQEWPKGR